MSTQHDSKAMPAAAIRRDFVPASDYSEQFHRLEMERVWPREWRRTKPARATNTSTAGARSRAIIDRPR